jgi:hypothetical protein
MRTILFVLALLGAVVGRAQIFLDWYGAAAPAAGLLLDDYPNAAAAYSLRLLRTAYTGNCIEVRRSSDNTTQNIGFAGGVVDTAALKTFCASTDCFVRTWYDQSGNGLNVTQTINTAQPTIVVGGIIQKSPTGKPAILFVSGRSLGSVNFSISSIPRTIFLVQNYNAVVDFPYIVQDGFNDRGVLYTSIGLRHEVYNNSTFIYTATTIELNKNYLWYVLLNSTSIQMNINNFGLRTGSAGGGSANRIFFGSRYSGTISEYINYFNNQSLNEASIRSNINAFYSIY